MNKINAFAYLLAVIAVVPAFAGTQATLYVSPDGSGITFSQAQPGSLLGARDYIRTINANMGADIVVYLYGGTYQLTNGVQLQENATTHDSGTGGYNIIYQAYPGQVPVLSGGMVVTNWSLFNVASNIWRAYVGTGVNSRQLYVNGVRGLRARGPLNPPGFTVNSTGFTITSAALQSWGNPTDIELVQRHDWKQFRCPMSSISSTRIVMQTPGWNYIGTTPSPGPPWNGNGSVSMNGVSWVENAYELLASPGMWYLNRKTGFLYYMPRVGENLVNAVVVLPVVEKLIDARGGAPATPIHNLVFSGLTFAYATWLLPSTSAGYADNQAGILWSNATTSIKTLGNISFQTAANIQLTNNVFEHLGGVGIDFGGGAHNNVIIGNHIEDIASCAITLGEVTDFATTDTNQMTDGNVIQDNYIRQPGQDYEDAVAFWGGYARNTLLAHNDMDNIPYSGVSLGWGWGTASYAANNRIVSNYVGKVMQTLSDGGSVYTMGPQTNSWEVGNYYKDSGGNGIYWDEGTSYYTGVSNVVDNCAGNWFFIHSSDGSNPRNAQFDTATNNFSNVTTFNNQGNANCVIANNTIVSGQSWPLVAQGIIQNAGLEPAFQPIALSRTTINDADTNCVYHGNWAYSTGRTFGDYNGDVHSTTTAGDYVDCNFYGTGIGAVCEANSNEGNVDVYLDGVFQTTVNCRSASRLPQQTIFRANGLSAQTHTLRLVNNGGQTLVVDAFVIQGVPEIIVNDTEADFDHVPSDWGYSSGRGDGDYHGDVHYAATDGQYLQYTFKGMGITWIGELNNDEGNADVYIDGIYRTTVNCYSVTRVAQQRLFSATSLSPGSHTIKLVKSGGSTMVLDAFAIVPLSFTLSAPASQNVTAGAVVSWLVNVSVLAGSPVTLSVNGLPPSASAVFSPASMTGSGVATLCVTFSAGTPLGHYPLTILGVSGTLTNSVPVDLTVSGRESLSFLSMHGGTLITPTIRAFSSYYNTAPYVRNVTNLVQNNFFPGEPGLTGPGYSTDTHDNGEDDVWHRASGDDNPYVTFDLGSTCNLLITRLWNLNQGISSDVQNGAKNVRVSVSADGVAFRVLGTNTLNEAGGTATELAQDFATPAAAIRYVKLEPLDGYGGGWNGLSAVRFVADGSQSPPLITAVIQGTPGFHYQIQYNSVLDGTANWQVLVDLPNLPGSSYSVPVLDGLVPGNPPRRFYRAAWLP